MPAAKPYELRTLAQVPADNVAGVEACWYARASDLVGFPTYDELVIRQNLRLRAGASWFQLVSSRFTVRYKQTQKDSRHGDIFQQRLSGVLTRHTAELAQGLEALEGQALVALYRDHNGQVQLLGTPEQPLKWTDAYDSGLEPFGQRNGYDWLLQADTPRRARPYLGTWTVSGAGQEGGLELGSGSGGTVVIRDAAGNILATVPAGRTVVLRSGFRVAYSIV